MPAVPEPAMPDFNPARPIWSRRWLLLFAAAAVCLLPSAARANGAMGLALATFAWTPWLCYVAVTVIFEAVALGRWLRVPTGRALLCSLGANLLTAILGGSVSGFVCAIFGFYGGRLNPNPFGQSLLLFTVFGIVSALIEACCWMRATAFRRGAVFLPSLIVHLVGVPLGLAILLLPARPYGGLESQVYVTRVYYFFQQDLTNALQSFIDEHGALPSAATYEALLIVLQPRFHRFRHDPDLWAAAYVPHYNRFDTTEMRREPMGWNARASGHRLSDHPEKTLWLIRSRRDGQCEGLVLKHSGVQRSNSAKELGY